MSSEIGRLVLIPKIDLAEFPLSLSVPTAGNCGGYILPSLSGTVYAYSPIDLAVAGIEAKRQNLIIVDLQQFFYSRRNTQIESEHDVYLGIDAIDGLCIHNVARWKAIAKGGLLAILQKNAPLTFRR